jgi:hypothetical protein
MGVFLHLRDAKARAEYLHAALECPSNACNPAVYTPSNSVNRKCRSASFSGTPNQSVAQ